MKALLDTSVLIAAVIEQHSEHSRAFAILEKVQEGKMEGVVSSHSLAEMYSVLTKSPPPFRHSPEQALLVIEENVLKYFHISHLTGDDYASLIREAALSGIHGGTIYDAVLVKSAEKANASRIYTLNLKHFQAISSTDMKARLVSP